MNVYLEPGHTVSASASVFSEVTLKVSAKNENAGVFEDAQASEAGFSRLWFSLVHCRCLRLSYFNNSKHDPHL